MICHNRGDVKMSEDAVNQPSELRADGSQFQRMTVASSACPYNRPATKIARPHGLVSNRDMLLTPQEKIKSRLTELLQELKQMWKMLTEFQTQVTPLTFRHKSFMSSAIDLSTAVGSGWK